MRYFLIRFARFLIVFFIVTFGVMVLMRVGMNAPGDPARTMLGGTASQTQIDEVTQRYHLDQNLLVQYFWWLKGMVTGDMGISVQQNITVADYIKPRILTTLFLGFYSIVWALIIAVPARRVPGATAATASATRWPTSSRSSSSPCRPSCSGRS